MDCYNLPIQQVISQQKSNANGLSLEEVNRRRQHFGSNTISPGRQITRLEIFISQFNNPLIFILLAASVVTAYLREWSDLITISAAILINVIVGYIQEGRAEDSFRMLRDMLSPHATVRREGKAVEVDASELVPGDIIILRAGDRVPADARLIVENDLEVMEAALTGESYPVAKQVDLIEKKDIPLGDRLNMVFMGTVVTQGLGEALVIATGRCTEMGKIASMLTDSSFNEPTPLQKQLSQFSMQLGGITLALCLFIFTLGLLKNHSFAEMFTTSVAVAVAAIPEGLVVGVTAILALGMQRILRKNALVRRLVAAETLGSTNVICSDKTGTLTLGEMRVTRITNFVSSDGQIKPVIGGREGAEDSNQLSFKIATLCNQAFVESLNKRGYVIRGTPTEKGMLLAALEAGFTKDALLKRYPLVDLLPFSSAHKYTISLHRDGDERIAFIAGAPEVTLSHVSYIKLGSQEKELAEEDRAVFEREHTLLSSQGLRIVALGYKRTKAETIEEVGIGDGFVLVSLVALKDPLRAEAREVLSLCSLAGIRTVIITGDHHLTASSIAREAGLDVEEGGVLTGEELHEISDEQLIENISKYNLYSRVDPQDKPRIVKAWQEKGAVVAMIGDGVNDAPAIKAADIGVSLGTGTDVAQNTSDLVLLDDNFRTIVDAIWEGRVIFANIRKVVLYLLSDGFSEVFLLIGALLLPNGGSGKGALPLLASQILWVNLITDGFPHLALTAEPGDADIIREPPRDLKEPVANAEIKWLILLISATTGAISLALFVFSQRWGGYSVSHARSLVFATLGIDSLLYVFSCRSLSHPLWKTDLLSNKYLLIAVFGGMILQLAPFFVSPLRQFLHLEYLSLMDWGLVLTACALVIALIEGVKALFHYTQPVKS